MEIQPVVRSVGGTVVCPKCGFTQAGDGTECLRCGIVFTKYKPSRGVHDDQPEVPHKLKPGQAEPQLLRRLFRILPWISLGILTLVLFMILKQAPPLAVQTDPQAAERVAAKMAQLQLAIQSHQPHATTLNEAELNQWMRENLAIASAHQASQAGIVIPAGQEATVREVQSALKDVRMNLVGSELRAYALFVMYGKEISLQLDGTLVTDDGYISLKPTAGRIGSLPIPSSTLDRVARQLFDSPQNRESFHLPPQVESVRIENNSLVIGSR
jgi:hypothetical protein